MSPVSVMVFIDLVSTYEGLGIPQDVCAILQGKHGCRLIFQIQWQLFRWPSLHFERNRFWMPFV